jgi:regulator of sigma E protease
MPNDRILRADKGAIDDWRDWVRYVQARAGQRIEVEVMRANRVVVLTLIPDTKQKDSKTYGFAGLGVKDIPEPSAELRTVVQYSPLAAAGQALTRTGEVSMLMLRMMYKMVVGEASIRNVSGPITIAQFAGHSAVAGLAESLAFIALVSISLGVLNLLPIPVLDGGHLLEFVKGSPVSERAQLLGQQFGLIVLAMLITLAFYNDITRLL